MEINGIMPGIEAAAVRLFAQAISDPGLTFRQSGVAMKIILPVWRKLALKIVQLSDFKYGRASCIFLSACFSIWRARSRVMLYLLPIS